MAASRSHPQRVPAGPQHLGIWFPRHRKRVKRFSDLDLLVDGPLLSLLESELIREAFDQSLLPFKVDLVELSSRTPEFRTRIKADKILLLL